MTGRERLVEGMKWDVVADDFTLEPPEGQDVDPVTVRREYLEHPGAVSVLAMDDDERVLLLRQYRHPVRHELWELPAGLLDLDGEEPLLAAERELWEEVDLRAGRYDLLVDFLNSPGGSDEAQRVFLARDVQVVPETERFTRENEEAGIITAWVPLDEAVADVLAGRIQNPGAVIALLAADAARRAGWSTLRPVDSPWPMHPTYRPAPRGTDAPST
ncbi:NUDIX domain-containing protein [Aquipuribacter sp. MA13-13]|uniref:NUDIX domain-containing protein n=1 Tax=Aquipuribacter sp. MA13-13 TaxID=3440840 RepID=UPI003F49AFD7